MADAAAISVHDLHKSFNLAENKHTSVKQLIVNLGRGHEKKRQKVLDGIDFEVKKGEFFGIVGRNGSGKSTLLKLLAGVYTPDSGSVTVSGNLTPFIELGVGFNPELSGHDNVYLSASLLGYTRKQVDGMYDDIVAFAELEEHMQKKLKNYSSGMQVRLAFAIAVKAKNDILIFDEVLAVGDEAFQQKCLRIFEEYRRIKQTVILVTHDMSSVRSLCTRAMLLEDGKIRAIGSVDSIADMYSDQTSAKNDAQVEAVKKPSITKSPNIAVKPMVAKKVYLPSEMLTLLVDWKGKFDPNETIIGIAIMKTDGTYVFGSNTRGEPMMSPKLKYEVKLDLGPGRYTVMVAMLDKAGNMIERTDEAFSFRIIGDDKNNVGGLTRLPYKYRLR